MNAVAEKQFLTYIHQHKGIISKIVRMYTDNVEDREDLQQEIIIQLWKSFGHYKGESQFSTWMYRVAINTAITFFKKDQRRPSSTTYEAAPEPKHEEYDGRQDKQLAIFYKCVQLLKPVEKALLFYFMEGLSHREIGQQLGISEGNARVKLNRSKEKLQEIIKTHGYEF